jgi:hypothetical protein
LLWLVLTQVVILRAWLWLLVISNHAPDKLMVLLHQKVLIRRIRSQLLLQKARWITSAFLRFRFRELLRGLRHLLLLHQVH